MRQGEDRFSGIPLQTLNVLRRIETLLERQAGESSQSATVPEPLSVEVDRGRNGYFSSVWGLGIPAELTLRWHPGTEALFPTTDQMTEAKSLWPKAVGWDFSTLGQRGV
ncbi:MAG: hypothetical protein IIB99_09395, partial [Planctomycetes bacterium]|nr:hypothetical protein [Planctomycetota bacterium]